MTEPGLVVVGAALAALHAVQSTRKTGYTGPVTPARRREHLPSNRPPLSKAFLAEGPAPTPTTFPAAASLAALGVRGVSRRRCDRPRHYGTPRHRRR